MTPPMEPYRDLLDRLSRVHGDLAPQVRKAARYVLDNPGKVGTLSMRKLAAAAQVPPPTLPRLAKAVGYETYESFRDVFRAHLQDQTVGYAVEAGRLQSLRTGDDSSVLVSAFRQASLQNVEHLFATLDPALVKDVARALRRAGTVYVIGMQASYAAAAYFQYVGAMAFGNWVLLDGRAGDFAEHAVAMTADDVLVAIAMPPSARESIAMADYARKRGATVVGITSTRTSSLAQRSDHILIVAMQSPQFFESFVTTILLLEVLLGLVVAESGKEAVDNIERVERSRRVLGEYWEDE